MLFANDNIDIGHCFIVSVKFGGVNFERECTNTASLLLPINRIFNFVFAFNVDTQV